MTIPVFVVCATCRETVALEWEPACFLVDDPLCGQEYVEDEFADAALLYGGWPGGDMAPTPLAAGAWAALATRAVGFVRRHQAHPDAAGLFIARKQPARTTLVPEALFTLPACPPFASPPDAAVLQGVRALTIEQRLELAAGFGMAVLWEMAADCEAEVPQGLLLAGWMPADAQDDERLLALVLDWTQGPVAEEALAVRIVLGTDDPGFRRQRLLAVAEAAYARRALGSSRVHPTPYDNAAPLEQLQAGAVECLTAAGRLDDACEFAARCAVPAARMPVLREALAGCILDRTLPVDIRWRRSGHACRIFPGLVAELRRERGLACDPLPDQPAWSSLADAARSMAALTIAPEAVHSALGADEVPVVVVALEVIRQLASVFPDEAVGFEPQVRALCRDPRIERRPYETLLCARARDVHGLLFEALGGAGAWEALNEVMDAMLSAGLGVSLSMHFRCLGANDIPVDRVGTVLFQRVADRTRPVKERVQAREALSVLAAEAAAVRRNEPRPSEEGRAAARKADDLLIAALKDPAEPDEFKVAIRSALTRWMPDRIPALRGNVVECVSVPSITMLVPGESIAGIDENEVVALLREFDADLGRVLAAIALAEPFVRMTPELASVFEPLLRARIADGRSFSDRARKLTIAVEAQRAHRAIWQRLKAGAHPGAFDLLRSLRAVAASQEAMRTGEHSLAADLAETVVNCVTPDDLTAIAAGLESDIADRRSRVWARLHAYHALMAMREYCVKADAALFAALADPTEDPVLRAEAHPLLAPRMRLEVHDLQTKGLLPRPPIPPVETIYQNLPFFERDTEGEWLLTPEGIRLGSLVYPDDVIAALREPTNNPSLACAAAALTPLVAQRLPAQAGRLAESLRGALDAGVELSAVIDGRPITVCLAKLCTEGLRAVGQA